jgi:hypothetical protein
MSNSATAKTSTTASSTPLGFSVLASSGSAFSGNRPHPPTYTDFGGYEAGHDGRDNAANSVHVSPGREPEPTEIVACGALAGHIREIATRRGWPVTVRPLSAALHNRPENIKSHAERMLLTPQAPNSRTILAYADCGTYGALDDLAAKTGVSRLPGLHCYDLYAGQARIEQLFAEEPGTYLLTDYLIKAFDRAVIQPLGLDRYPQLWTDYFGHYTRLVWLAQRATTELEEAATRIAAQFNLPLTRIDTGTRRLEEALAALLEEKA